MRTDSVPTLVRVGIALVVFGLICIAVDVIGFFTGWHNTPWWLNVCCLAAPIGFLIAVWGMLREGRTTARRARAELDSDEEPAEHDMAD